MRFLLYLLLLFYFPISAQQEVKQWFFGNNAGINFKTGLAYPTGVFPISAFSGSTVMNDCNGDLLFYSNGEEIRNAQHQHLINDLINGNDSKPIIAIPYPAHPNMYYLVYISDGTNNTSSLTYSVIDMNVPGGSVIIKDQNLVANVCNKLGAVHDETRDGYWFTVHKYNDDRFISFHITNAGLILAPTVSSAGPALTSLQDKEGAFEYSKDGRSLVNVTETGNIGVFNFDRTTGAVTLQQDLSALAINNPLYASLSPSKDLLYITSESDKSLYQVNLAAGSLPDILNSLVLVDALTTESFGDIRIGPDGKIYIAHSSSAYLATINNPDLLFPSCNYQLNGLFLNGNTSANGLPRFVQTYFSTYTSLQGNSKVCADSIIQMQLLPVADTAIVTWTADPGVQILNSTDKTCTLTSSVPGIYIVNAIIQYPCGTDILSDTLFINELPLVDLGSDTSLCEGQTLTVTLANNNYNFLWSDGDISPTKDLQADQTYSVTVSNLGCESSDEITIDLLPQKMSLLKTGSLCDLYNQFPECSVTNAITVNWFPDNIVQSVFSPQESGYYWFIAEDDSGCTYTDTLFIKDECPVSVYIPSAFTPDNDGINDYLITFLSRPEITEGTLQIFNRYGQNIYSADLINANWNGTFNNNKCPEGIYIYKAMWKDEEGITVEKTGGVLLMR